MTGSDHKIEDAGVVTSVRPTRGQRLKAHYKKWWWAHLINFFVFALVTIIIAIYGVVPPVAQKLIDKTTLTVNTLSILNPSPTSFEISMNATINGANGPAAHARIEEFKVKLFLDDNGKTKPIRPILEMPVPETHGGGPIPVIQNDVFIPIEDEGALDQYSKQLMDNVDMRVGMRGRTTVWLGKIHTGVNYNEVVTLKAFNKLKGMTITSYTIKSNDTRGNIFGDVMIPNPTVTTIQMGDVGLKIAFNGSDLGTGVIENLILKPGNNSYKFITRVPLTELGQMAMAAATGDPLTIGSNGTSIDGVKIPWLSKPLEDLESLVPINTKYWEEVEGREAPESSSE